MDTDSWEHFSFLEYLQTGKHLWDHVESLPSSLSACLQGLQVVVIAGLHFFMLCGSSALVTHLTPEEVGWLVTHHPLHGPGNTTGNAWMVLPTAFLSIPPPLRHTEALYSSFTIFSMLWCWGEKG